MENFSETMLPWLWNLIVAGVAIVAGVLVKYVVHQVFNYYSRRSDSYLSKSIIKYLERPVLVFIPLFILNLSILLMQLTNQHRAWVDKAMEIALIISFAWILIQIVKIFEDVFNHKYSITKADNLKERKIKTQLQFVRQIVVVLIIMLTVAAILLSFDSLRKVGAGLLTGVGIGGIIIGFAAQSSLSNLLAGFQIAFTQPMRIGDVVIAENEWGVIEEITLTYVVMALWDKRRLVLPIRYFIEKPFQNWTRTSSDLLGAVYLYMDYSLPIDALRKEFDRLMENSKLWDRRVKVVQVTNASENTIEIRALMSARNSSEAFDLRCYIRENLIAFIQQNYPDSLPKNRAELIAPLILKPSDGHPAEV